MKRTSRKPSKLSVSLQRHLNAYALAASAVGVGTSALSQVAEAKIIYTPAHVRIGLHGVQSYPLSLDNKHRDFVISWASGGTSMDPSQEVAIGTGSYSGKGMVGKSLYTSALRAGDRIGSTGEGDNGKMALFRSHKFYGQWANGGKGVKNRYLGLEFLINGKMHYGWARLSVHATLHQIVATLTGYAYETISNKPIIAGKTKGPDVMAAKPASLGALAAGASAIPTWRQTATAGTQ